MDRLPVVPAFRLPGHHSVRPGGDGLTDSDYQTCCCYGARQAPAGRPGGDGRTAGPAAADSLGRPPAAGPTTRMDGLPQLLLLRAACLAGPLRPGQPNDSDGLISTAAAVIWPPADELGRTWYRIWDFPPKLGESGSSGKKWGEGGEMMQGLRQTHKPSQTRSLPVCWACGCLHFSSRSCCLDSNAGIGRDSSLGALLHHPCKVWVHCGRVLWETHLQKHT
jgi:hypothetical protein